MNKIRETFSKIFTPWSITIDEEELFIGNKKEISYKGWKVKFVVEEDEKGRFLEYYETNLREVHVH